MSLQVKLDACLDALGLLGVPINWDHTPPLAMREPILDQDGEIVGYIPDENDPRHIRPMIDEAHKAKTNGSAATSAGGDIHKIAKTKRLREDPPGGEEFRARLLQREPKPETKPKRKWASRKFPKRKGRASLV